MVETARGELATIAYRLDELLGFTAFIANLQKGSLILGVD
jgi:hypothetical protein